jgi:hypothetical protein
MVKVCKPDGEGTIAGTRGNGEDAPTAALRRASGTERMPGDSGHSPTLR